MFQPPLTPSVVKDETVPKIIRQHYDKFVAWIDEKQYRSIREWPSEDSRREIWYAFENNQFTPGDVLEKMYDFHFGGKPGEEELVCHRNFPTKKFNELVEKYNKIREFNVRWALLESPHLTREQAWKLFTTWSEDTCVPLLTETDPNLLTAKQYNEIAAYYLSYDVFKANSVLLAKTPGGEPHYFNDLIARLPYTWYQARNLWNTKSPSTLRKIVEDPRCSWVILELLCGLSMALDDMIGVNPNTHPATLNHLINTGSASPYMNPNTHVFSLAPLLKDESRYKHWWETEMGKPQYNAILARVNDWLIKNEVCDQETLDNIPVSMRVEIASYPFTDNLEYEVVIRDETTKP